MQSNTECGNRTSKRNGDGEIVYYVNDVSSELTYVLVEYAADMGDMSAAENISATEESFGLGNVSVSNEGRKSVKRVVTYVRGDELLSMERGEEKWYYVYDGHGNTERLVDETGKTTDQYVYDAYGNLLVSEGDTENEFLYCGEQYNVLTGLYYLRARYMNPGTGTFISEDAYAGRIHEPVTLHKYLYANDNPVRYIDPSGYMSLGEGLGASEINGILSSTVSANLTILLNVVQSIQYDLAVRSFLMDLVSVWIFIDMEKNPEETLGRIRDIGAKIEEYNVEDQDDSKYDEYLDDESSRRVRIGHQNGNAPRNNQKQNEQFKKIVKNLNLTKKQMEQLHREISHMGDGFQDVLEFAKRLFDK